MAEKKYFSSVILGVIFIALMIQSTLDPVQPGLWLVLAVFVGFGLLVQILVVNGIMQVTPVNQMPRNRMGGTYNRTVIDYRNYHYKSIVAKINSSGVTVTTVDEAIKTYSSLFNVGEKAAKPFFQNQFVMSTLGLSNQNTAQVSYPSKISNQKSKKVDSKFWENVSQGVAKNEAESDEICADPNCSKPVSAFDFRCFKCRSRFCADCESGKGIMCKACS